MRPTPSPRLSSLVFSLPRAHHLSRGITLLTALWFALSGSHAATGTETSAPASNLTLSGDLRLRYEWDWDSQNAAGVARTDRDRARLRARIGAAYKLSSEWSMGARLRTGSKLSQQSPHLTFAANDHLTDDAEVQFDRYFVQYKQGAFSGWAGRNSTPFWQQNELFWDEDVTPTGVAGTYETSIDNGRLAATVGAFYLPDGAVDLNGRLLGAQLKYSVAIKPSQFTVAAGLHYFDGHDGARNLRNRNGARDYLVGVLSTQWTTPLASGLPLTLGADFFNNFEDYSVSAAAPLPASNAGETTGFVLSAQVGQLKKAHDWTAGYFYARIGTFAVNASYAQDDWVRFGNGPQTDGTDIKGHELRAAYAITGAINVMARFFIVDAITTQQDGKRFRIDLNWKF
jgi:hypothetical protein